MDEIVLINSDGSRKTVTAEFISDLIGCEEEVEVDSDVCSVCSEENIVEVLNNPDCESEVESENESVSEEPETLQHLLISKSGRKYTTVPPKKVKRSIQNIYKGPVQAVLSNDVILNDACPSSAFLNFFTKDIRSMILKYTNQIAETKEIEEFSDCEMLGLLGVLVIMGADYDTKHSLKHLWSNLHSKPLYKAAFSRIRFEQFLTTLCFDDKNSRTERREIDNFAPFRELFEKFNLLCQKYVIPGINVTIDEMLSLFRGRCGFKVFMKDKPGKYGIMIRMLTDVTMRYVIKMEVYCGMKNPITGNERGPSFIVKRLVEQIKATSRNVTTDRFYTSVDLAEDLYKNYCLTLVGTLQKNRKHIPEFLKCTGNRELYSSIFAFSDPSTNQAPVTLQSYISKIKPKRNLLLLSTQHADQSVDNSNIKMKSDINLFYNKTKGGVDTVDGMVRMYSCKRGTRRWTLSLFYTLIDIAGLNAYAMFTKKYPTWKMADKERRKNFMLELGQELIKTCVDERIKKPTTGLHKSVVAALELVSGTSLAVRPQAPGDCSSTSRKRCYECVKEVQNKKQKYSHLSKMKQTCYLCERNVCKNHSTSNVVCIQCGVISVPE